MEMGISSAGMSMAVFLGSIWLVPAVFILLPACRRLCSKLLVLLSRMVSQSREGRHHAAA
jgi:hypothetical protein